MFPKQFSLDFLIFLLLIGIPTAFLAKHPDLPEYTGSLEHSMFQGKKCHCKRMELTNMAPVQFENGHNYMVDTETLGEGTYAKVYHALPMTSEWDPYSEGNFNKCVAIKVPNLNDYAKEYLNKEAAVLGKIWDAYLNPDRPQRIIDILEMAFPDRPEHIIGLLKVECFKTDEQSGVGGSTINSVLIMEKTDEQSQRNAALVMELGIKTFDEYWKENTEFYKRHALIHEFVILKVLRQIAAAIEEVHERGYIYIDLKPSNIVVTKMPGVNILLANNVDQLELKLIDFAGALEYEGVDQSSRKNAPNVEVRWPLCSPYYAPPELTDEKKWGMPKKVSPLSDLFSFGRLALEMIVQTPYFENYITEHKLNEKLRAEVGPGTPLTSKDIIDKTLQTIKSWGKIRLTNPFRNFFYQLKKTYPHVIKIIMKTQRTDQVKRKNAEQILEKISNAEINILDDIDKYLKSDDFTVLKNAVHTHQKRHGLLNVPDPRSTEISSSGGHKADDENSGSETEHEAEIQLVDKGKGPMHGVSFAAGTILRDSTGHKMSSPFDRT